MRIKTVITAIVLAGMSIVAQAQEFTGLVEGRDYLKSKIVNTVVDSNQKKPVLVEFFWYGCSHCFNIKNESEKLAKKYGNKIVAIKYPVGFETWEAGGRIFFTLEQMKLLEKMHHKTFDILHVSRKNIMADQKLREAFLPANGVDIKKFNEIYNSFTVSSQWNKAKTIVQSHQIGSSPHFTVYSGGYAYQVSPAIVGDPQKTILNLDKILTAKTK